MPSPINSALVRELEAVVKGENARKAAHEADVASASGVCWSGMGPSPFRDRTMDEMWAEAERRLASRMSPEAVLKRRLIAAAEAGSHEAERVLSAASRGDQGWAEWAETLLAQARAA